MKDRDRYLKIVEWSDEDNCYVGSVPGWIGLCCHGNNEKSVYSQLCRIVDEWIEIYRKDGRMLPPSTSGKKYPEKFQLCSGNDLNKVSAVNNLTA
ncbi:HicB family protein (fragment) [Desulfamplus magnetovallimortis]|uniref:HicB family protein n=1 Tax=Desulfamplus magnetovallimortis TaxID=1246637 RepID=A0A1W1HL08_9BACT